MKESLAAEAPSSTTIFTTMVTKDNFEFNMSQFTSFYLEHRVKPKLFDERVFLACQGADKPHVIASGDLTSSKIYAEMKKRFERYRDQASGNAGSAGKEEVGVKSEVFSKTLIYFPSDLRHTTRFRLLPA